MTKQCPRWPFLFLVGLAACATPPPSAADPASPPWQLHHTFPGWDGKPIEVLGAPGPRAVAVFLSLAMERTGVSRPEDLGDTRREVPDFYEVHFKPAAESGAREDWWSVRSSYLFRGIEWHGSDPDPPALPMDLLRSYSLGELALAINDVVWKWPRRPGHYLFMRPVLKTEVIGHDCARRLRKKLDRGLPLERAWQELLFQHNDAIYVLTLLPDARLRVSWHPEIPPEDLSPPEPWVGKY